MAKGSVIICGGRYYDDPVNLFRALDRLDEKHHIVCVVEGASDDVTGPYKGADYWARQWAMARRKQHVSVHADWKKLGRAAGPIRNRDMLEMYQPNLVIAFPGGRGTDSMIEIAQEAKVKVVNAFEWMK